MIVNPKGKNDDNSRIIRGGSWEEDIDYCRIECRGRDWILLVVSDVGLRVVFMPVKKRR